MKIHLRTRVTNRAFRELQDDLILLAEKYELTDTELLGILGAAVSGLTWKAVLRERGVTDETRHGYGGDAFG